MNMSEFVFVYICMCLGVMQKKVVGFDRLTDRIDSDRYMAN